MDACIYVHNVYHDIIIQFMWINVPHDVYGYMCGHYLHIYAIENIILI
jgi:hypothetical protein